MSRFGRHFSYLASGVLMSFLFLTIPGFGQRSYTLYGRVYDNTVQMNGVPNVEVIVYQPGTANPVLNAFTDGNGRYRIEGITAEHIFFWPYMPGIAFGPIGNSYYHDWKTGDTVKADFLATRSPKHYYIDVYTLTASGQPIIDAEVRFENSQGSLRTRQTTSAGWADCYPHGNDPEIGLYDTYRISASKPGWTFAPVSQSVSGSCIVIFIGTRRQSLEDDIVGRWRWFDGGETIFSSDFTIVQRQRGQIGNRGKWEVIDRAQRRVVLRWSQGGPTETMVVSIDGQRMDGTSNVGSRVWAQKIDSLDRAGSEAETKLLAEKEAAARSEPVTAAQKEAISQMLKEIAGKQRWNADEYGAIAAPIWNARTRHELEAAEQYMKDCAQCHETFLSAKKPIDEGLRNGTISPNDARTRVGQLTRELWACRAAAFEKYKKARILR